MNYYPIGSKLYLDDGRIGTITGVNRWGQHEVWPDNPTDDEFIRNTHHLINVGEENPVLEDESW